MTGGMRSRLTQTGRAGKGIGAGLGSGRAGATAGSIAGVFASGNPTNCATRDNRVYRA